MLIRSDLKSFLSKRYAADNITDGEIDSIIRKLDALNAADLYDSNKTVCKWVPDGFLLKREDRNQKDLYIQLIDYGGSGLSRMDTLVRPKVSDRAGVPNYAAKDCFLSSLATFFCRPFCSSRTGQRH